MRTNFEKCLALVLAHEGGWSDHPRDPGGATMKGITLATYRSYINRNGTKDDLRRITGAQIATVYRKQYWDKLGCDNLASGVDYAVFDFGVNSGPGRAKTHLLKAIGGDDATTVNRICDSRMAFLRGLKTWKTFGRGWTNRVTGVRNEALRMVAKAPEPAKPKPAPTKPAAPATGKRSLNLAAILAFLVAAAGAAAVILDKLGVI